MNRFRIRLRRTHLSRSSIYVGYNFMTDDKVEEGEKVRKNGSPSETEGIDTIRDAIDLPSDNPNIGAVTPAGAFAEPTVTLKDSDKLFLKKLISAAISERLAQVDDVHLGDTNLAIHLSVLFLLTNY